MIGLTTLTNNGRPLVAPKLNRRRALFVLAKIDEILGWEKAMDRERDTRFVELGPLSCAKSARGNTGGSTISNRSMNSSRSAFPNPGVKPTT